MKFAPFLVALLLVGFDSGLSENFELLILHNNDMHGRFEESGQISWKCKPEHRGNCYGGFARTAHLVREARKAASEGKGPNVLFLNAGDTYTGTPWFSVHKWKIASDFLNLLHPDVMSFGNHEFDQKVDGIVPFLNAASFPVVAANLDFSDEPKLQATNVSKSVVLDVAGRKIGIIGFLTPETGQISAPEKVKFEDEVVGIKEESNRLDKQGVKIIIALGHSGYETDKRIAREVPLVDLVVGGHTNTFLWNGPKPDLEEPEGPYPTVVKQSSGKEVPIVQAYAYTKYLGHLNIVFDDEGNAVKYSGLPILINNTIPQEQDFLDLLELFRPAVEELDKTIVGRSKVILDGSVESCRHKECNFGNLITDAYVDYHSSLYGGSYWTDTPIAIVNGGAIRNTIEPKLIDGSITRGELMGAMPFDDEILSMSLNGSDILETLEIGVRSNGETSRGELLQVSGIRYRFDPSKPVGHRITDVKIRCGLCSVPIYEPLVPHKAYRIMTTGFLNTGGDGHHVIRDRGYQKVREDLTDLDIVAWYIEKVTPVYPEEDERILVVKVDDKETEGGNDDGDGGGAQVSFASAFLVTTLAFGLNFVQ